MKTIESSLEGMRRGGLRYRLLLWCSRVRIGMYIQIQFLGDTYLDAFEILSTRLISVIYPVSSLTYLALHSTPSDQSSFLSRLMY